MLFIFPQGRFGNQVFQYMFSKHIAKGKEKIITTTAPYFDIIDENRDTFYLIPNKKYFRYINFGLNKLFWLLGTCRIITHITANKNYIQKFQIENKGYKEKKGILKFIRYVDGFFINNDEHISGKELKIKTRYLDKANQVLNRVPKGDIKIFIHIRRGDYINWSVMGQQNLTLPTNFYKEQIDYFLNKHKNVSFIFLSDDIEYCKKEFHFLGEKAYFSNHDFGTDFAIMTLCDGAIISASSLSYLGAYFMKNKVEIFAPKYMLGFKSGIWYPNGIHTNKFIFMKII